MTSRATVVATLRNLHGNKIGAAIEELHRSERELARGLLSVADQRHVDHEIFHVARDIAGWSHEHVRRLAEAGRRYGLDLEAAPDDRSGIVARAEQKASDLSGRFHEPALLLIADLRHLHRQAAGVSLDWEVLAQSAQALRDLDLVALAQQCHPETLRQLRWANAKVKEATAQVMIT